MRDDRGRGEDAPVESSKFKVEVKGQGGGAGQENIEHRTSNIQRRSE